MLSRKANCLNTRCITVVVVVFLCTQNVLGGGNMAFFLIASTHFKRRAFVPGNVRSILAKSDFWLEESRNNATRCVIVSRQKQEVSGSRCLVGGDIRLTFCVWMKLEIIFFSKDKSLCYHWSSSAPNFIISHWQIKFSFPFKKVVNNLLPLQLALLLLTVSRLFQKSETFSSPTFNCVWHGPRNLLPAGSKVPFAWHPEKSKTNRETARTLPSFAGDISREGLRVPVENHDVANSTAKNKFNFIKSQK